MAAVLLRMTGLDSLDSNAEPQPPNGESAQVEEPIGRGKGHTVVGTNGLGQAAFFKQALEGGKGALFLDGFHSFAEQEKTAGIVGDGKGVAISFVHQHELALVVGAPQRIRSESFG